MIGKTEREGMAPDIRLSCLDKAEEETIKFIIRGVEAIACMPLKEARLVQLCCTTNLVNLSQF